MTTNKTTVKKAKSKSNIVESDTVIRVHNNAVYLNYGEITYISNKEFLEKLLEGKLKKSDHKRAKAVQFGLLTEDGIDNDNGIFLTVKGKAVYVCPEDGVLLISSVAEFTQLLNAKIREVVMGVFED